MTTEARTLTDNELLCGLEAEARDEFAQCAAGVCACGQENGQSAYPHTPENAPAAYAIYDADGLLIIVGYNGRALPGGDLWQYMFSAYRDMALRGKFDTRYSCLLALGSRRAVAG